jgi:tRNA pseudouridine65 synthase
MCLWVNTQHPGIRWYRLHAANGRMHQLRKHFAHIFHPIIGDRTHGCNKQNKLFKDKWEMETMLLHAEELSFTHPINGSEIVTINAPLQPEFLRGNGDNGLVKNFTK